MILKNINYRKCRLINRPAKKAAIMLIVLWHLKTNLCRAQGHECKQTIPSSTNTRLWLYDSFLLFLTDRCSKCKECTQKASISTILSIFACNTVLFFSDLDFIVLKACLWLCLSYFYRSVVSLCLVIRCCFHFHIKTIRLYHGSCTYWPNLFKHSVRWRWD